MEEMDDMDGVSCGGEVQIPHSSFRIPHLLGSGLSWPLERGHRARRK